MAKYLTLEGLQSFWSGVKAKLATKVDKVEGKGLSTNDLTDELKAKYDAAQANVIESIKVNGGEALPISEKTVDIEVPTTVAELTDAADYAKVADVASTYATKAEVAGNITKQVVDVLPEGDAIKDNVIYLVPKASDNEQDQNVFVEWMYLEDKDGNKKFEIIGDTRVDLTDYAKTAEVAATYATKEELQAVSTSIVAITEEEIAALFVEEETQA